MDVTTKDLWAWIETHEDGSARNTSLELLTPAVGWPTVRAAGWWP